MPVIYLTRRGATVPYNVSNRRYRNHKQRCDCLGFWFPHRVGSRASPELFLSHGTFGCEHARRPNVVYRHSGTGMMVEFTDPDTCPF